MINYPQMLLIAGTDRNVGKTTFACKIIEQISQHTPVTAIKITPHFHKLTDNQQIIYQSEQITISIENTTNMHKDSSRMLNAGAEKVFYIQCVDADIKTVFKIIKPLIPKHNAVVCESGAAHNYINPGIFVVLTKSNSIVKNNDKLQKADMVIKNFDFNCCKMYFENSRWQIKS